LKRFSLFFLIILVLSGCSRQSDSVSFEGSNEHWKVNVILSENEDTISSKATLTPTEGNQSIQENEDYTIGIYPSSSDNLPITDSEKEKNKIMYDSETRYDELPSNKISLRIEIGDYKDAVQLDKVE
jgi:uncharacterized membrane protein